MIFTMVKKLGQTSQLPRNKVNVYPFHIPKVPNQHLYNGKVYVYFIQVKKNMKIIFIENSTEGGTRTPTGLHPPDFESGASTNSATPAVQKSSLKLILIIIY